MRGHLEVLYICVRTRIKTDQFLLYPPSCTYVSVIKTYGFYSYVCMHYACMYLNWGQFKFLHASAKQAIYISIRMHAYIHMQVTDAGYGCMRAWLHDA